MQTALLISCEHGGNDVPGEYAALFAPHAALLDSHRGIDFGSLVMAEHLAAEFAAPLVASTITRLLIDLNRSRGHPRRFSVVTRELPRSARAALVERYWQPYRQAIDQALEGLLARGLRVLHISSHSFTPELDGEQRQADVGLLYDPARPGERALCLAWQRALRVLDPALRVRRNYPYAGKADGLTTELRRRLPDARYLGIELEINQAIGRAPAAQWLALRQSLAASLRQALPETLSPAGDACAAPRTPLPFA